MSLDLTVLRMMKHRDRHAKLSRSIPARVLDVRMRIILDDFRRYFDEHPLVTKIDPESFGLWFKLVHPKVKDEELSVYTNLFAKFKDDNSPGVEAGIMDRVMAADAAASMIDTLNRWNEGEEIDLLQAVRKHVLDFESSVHRKVVSTQDLTPIEQILTDEENEVGFTWPLQCQRESIKPLRGGDFLVLAARPDIGKTTAIAQTVTHMAPQVDTIYPGENRSILWLCNEGPTKQIIYRTWQSALGITDEEMFRRVKIPHAKYGHQLRADYCAAIGGRLGVLRVFPIHGKKSHEVEDIIQQYPPALVVFDMIDNVEFSGGLANLGTRTDQVLETMYQWARLLGVKYDAAMIATSQISGEGADLAWPGQHMLKDSKTGKQGAADIIMMLGAKPDAPGSRYISTPKNKRKRTGRPSNMQSEVVFNGDIARLVEGSQ